MSPRELLNWAMRRDANCPRRTRLAYIALHFGSGPGAWLRRCAHCGKVFAASRPDARYCDYRCKADAFLKRYHERHNPALWCVGCKQCHKVFTAERKDTLFCSNACRQRHYRAKKVTELGK